MFYQASPHTICQSRGLSRVCRNPRCSVRCYRSWGRKESVIMARYLKSLPEGHRVYVGTLTVQADLSIDEHKAARKSFCLSIRQKFGSAVKFHAVMEVGEDGRPHSHYVMSTTTGVSVSHEDIKSIWQSACPGLATRVHHEPPKDITAWCRYIFGDCRKFVRLPAKAGLQLTWGSRPFLPAGVKARVWASHIAETFPAEPAQPARRLRVVRLSRPPAPPPAVAVAVADPTAAIVASGGPGRRIIPAHPQRSLRRPPGRPGGLLGDPRLVCSCRSP